MRGGYAVEPEHGGGLLEKNVAFAAAGGFQREVPQLGTGGYIDGDDEVVEVELLGECSDEIAVGIGFGTAKLVVEVQYEQDDANFRRDFGQCSQQGHRVRPAADGHADALAGANQTMAAQILFQRLQHTDMIAEAGGATGRVGQCRKFLERFAQNVRAVQTNVPGWFGHSEPGLR